MVKGEEISRCLTCDTSWFTIRSSSLNDNEYTYTGRRLDKETGVYYYRHRGYLAEQGRFLSRDPILYSDGVSLAEYVHGSATTETDPLGKCALNKKVEFCGPEMLPSLVLTLASVRDDVAQIGFLNRWFPILWPWDITFPVNAVAGCPTKACVDCITVNGVKQRTWDVNYVLLGCLLQGTASSVEDGLNMAWVWKNAKGIGNEYDCQLERWIWAGFVHCKYNVPLSKLIALAKGAPVQGAANGDMGSDKFAVGCPICDDPKYKQCQKCPKEPWPIVMNYDLPYYFN